MRVRLNEQAREEAAGARQWYSAISRAQSAEFLAELARIRRILAQYPEAGASTFRDHRRFVMDGFPYAVYYRIESQAIVIVAVAHTSRRPGYWLNR